MALHPSRYWWRIANLSRILNFAFYSSSTIFWIRHQYQRRRADSDDSIYITPYSSGVAVFPLKRSVLRCSHFFNSCRFRRWASCIYSSVLINSDALQVFSTFWVCWYSRVEEEACARYSMLLLILCRRMILVIDVPFVRNFCCFSLGWSAHHLVALLLSLLSKL